MEDPIFCVKWKVEEFKERIRLFMVFIDLWKTYNRVLKVGINLKLKITKDVCGQTGHN